MSRVKHTPPRRRIVIVDDEVIVRESIRLALEHAGYAVTAVEDHGTAMASIKAASPDLVVMDLYMPGGDGREIMRAMKSDPATAKTPVIVFTGSSEPIDVVTGLQSGAIEYLAKPVDGEVLLGKIRRILAR